MIALATAVVLVLSWQAMFFAGSALAVGGAVINVGAQFPGAPAVAVDAAGTAYVAWPEAPAYEENATTIGYCTVPLGATTCSASGTLTPTSTSSPPAGINVVSLAVDGSTVVLVANVTSDTPADVPQQEWTAPDGTTNFSAVDNGESVAATEGGGESTANLVVLPGTSSLGWGFGQGGDNSALFVVWSGADSLSDPPVCSFDSAAGVNGSPCPDYAELNNPNGVFVSQFSGDYASQTSGPEQGVLGVFDSPFTACPSRDPVNGGTSFVYGTGAQSSANSYGIAPGSPGSAWHRGIANIDCTGSAPAAGSGPSGFGELEYNAQTQSIVYQRFVQATGAFEPGETTIAQDEGSSQTSVSQDGTGGIYATWVADSAIRLAYSADGGTSFSGPVSLVPGPLGYPFDVSSAVGTDGRGWAVSNEKIPSSGTYQVFVQPFADTDAAPGPTAITTKQTSGRSSGASISIKAGTTGESDRATLTGTNVSTATGTVEYDLYRHSTCAADGTAAFGGGRETVTNGTAGPSKSVKTALPVGRYYWQATYSGDARNAPVTSRCGSEILTVTAAAKNKKQDKKKKVKQPKGKRGKHGKGHGSTSAPKAEVVMAAGQRAQAAVRLQR